MKIYYWSPFFTNIATVSAVINSAESLIKYSKDKDENEITLIDAIGEWEKYKNQINSKIQIIKLNKLNYIDFLPKNSFLKSRVSYLFIFLLNFFKLISLINKKKPDFLIVHLMTSLPIFLSLFFNKKTKIILRISGLPKLNFFRLFFWKFFSKNIYKITCPTISTYNQIINKNIFDKKKIFVLRDPIIKIDEFLKKKKENLNIEKLKNKKFIVGIGRLTKQKNFTLMIKFFKKITNKYPQFHLVLIGDGEEKNILKKMIIDLNIEEKVHIMGYQKNVYKFLLNSECFILPSLWEDPGFVIVEAALTNTNIISSKCPNGPEEILQNEGFLFKNNNLNDLVDKFEKFLKTKENIRYKNKVTLKKRIKQYTQLHHYKKLIQIIY